MGTPVTLVTEDGLPAPSFEMSEAMNEIRKQFGDRVSISKKGKSLLKFGKDPTLALNTETTVMELLGSETSETYVSTNIIDRFVSDDSGLIGSIYVEGHTIDADGKAQFSIQTIQANGLTPVALTTPIFRVSRISNQTGTALAASKKGYIYQSTASVTSGVPQDATKTHIIMSAGNDQSFKAATTISDNDYLIITQIYGDVNRKKGAVVDMRLYIKDIASAVFLPKFERTLAQAGTSSLTWDIHPALVIPRNSDVIITANSDTNAVSFSCGFNGYLAEII